MIGSQPNPATIANPAFERDCASAVPRRRSPRAQVWGWVVCLAAAVFGIAPTAIAQDDGFLNREYPLKALFLFNFGGYVEWPADAFGDAKSPFVIGVLGAADLDDTLNRIAAQKTIAGRRIVYRRYRTLDEVKPCQILFVSRAVPQAQQLQVIRKMKGKPVLTVGESSSFATDGGCINFFLQSNKIRFEINVEAVKQQQLKVNSKLLAMAKIVGETPP